MNFAFPALLIFLLALPGILLRMGYRKGVNGAWKNPFVIQSLGDEIAWSSIFAGVLHILWVRGWNHFKGPVDFASAMSLLVATNGGLVKDAIEKTSRGAGDVVLYFSTLVVFAYSVGVGAHWLVRSRGLDHRFKMLRFDNPWFYCLSGEFISSLPPESWIQWRPLWWPSGNKEQADVVRVSAVVKHGSDAYIYIGRLVDFEFDRNGQLDRIVLSETSRRQLSMDRDQRDRYGNANPVTHDKRFYEIESRYFVIRYADISTLNITYHLLLEADHPPFAGRLAQPGSTKPRWLRGVRKVFRKLLSWGGGNAWRPIRLLDRRPARPQSDPTLHPGAPQPG
ncbi:MAG: hypothetical protein ACKOPT_14365 [Cyanobium sp.]